jgi:asparagine synthase (glutamine-hydrolysing)
LAALSTAPHPSQAAWVSDAELVQHRLADRYRPDESVTGIDRAVHFDIECYLPGDILVKIDRAAMAHGLETRSPFLDVELVEFVWSLPAKMRFASGGLKPLLRRACRDLWPESVAGRGKQGFGAPLRAWLDQPSVVDLCQRVFRPDSSLAAVIPAAGQPIHELGRTPQLTWNLLCLGLWLEKHSSCLANLPLAA